MARKAKLPYSLCGLFLVAALICGPLAFSQGTSSAAPAQNQIPADQMTAWEQLTPYQKSQLERTYNDWPFLAKFRDANKLVPPLSPGETRVVFMGDSITEGWGMKATATTPARGEFSQENRTSIAAFPDKLRRRCWSVFARTSYF